jgi:CBS-domain-containing membrane protein
MAVDVMVTAPKTMPSASTIGDARKAFEDDHVHMLLLTSQDRLEGTLVRSDVPTTALASLPALSLASLEDRWTAPTTPVSALVGRLERTGGRRLAVVDAAGGLLGLVCWKRGRDGFCNDADVVARLRTRPTGQV